MSQELGNLVKKLAIIKGAIGVLQKDAKHQQGYNYYSSEQILATLNQKTSDAGIMIFPSSSLREIVMPVDGLTRVFYDYQFQIVDAESGASITATWTQDAPMSMATKAGSIIADDKASGKAHTYAFKYWLMKVFMVSSQEDVDLDQNVQEPDTKSQAKPAQQQTQAPRPAQSAPQANNVPSCATGDPKPVKTIEVFTNKKGDKQVKIDNATMFGFSGLELLGLDVPTEDGVYEYPELLIRAEQKGAYWNINKIKLIEDGSVVEFDGNKWKSVPNKKRLSTLD